MIFLNLRNFLFFLAKFFLISLSAGSALANDSFTEVPALTPAVICLEESGFRYEFYLGEGNAEASTILAFDERGDAIYQYKNLVMQIVVTRDGEEIRFVDPRFGNDLAILKFSVGRLQGSGEMVDHDQTMVCARSIVKN